MKDVLKHTGLYPVFAENYVRSSEWGYPIPIPIGYLGSRRNEIRKRYDENIGEGNWRVVWGDKQSKKIYDFYRMCEYYRRSYFEFLKERPDILEFLQLNCANVCTWDDSDRFAGCNYLDQNGEKTQLLAITIRNVMVDLKLEFYGQGIIYLMGSRMSHEICKELHPKKVPFCKPEMIFFPHYEEIEKEPFSVEDFYQNNRFLQIRRRKH